MCNDLFQLVWALEVKGSAVNEFGSCWFETPTIEHEISKYFESKRNQNEKQKEKK